MNRFVLAAVLVLCACGADPAPVAQLTLALEEGAELQATAGRRTDVVLIVLGAKGREVSLTLDAAPPFVTLSGGVLAIEPERTAGPGPYDVTITASAGADSDPKTVKLVLVRSNAVPELRASQVVDTRGVAAWHPLGPSTGCLDGLRAWGSLFEPGDEQDATRLEVEVVPDGAPFTGVATSASDWITRRPAQPAAGGSWLDFSYDLPGIVLGAPYRVALRGVDELGGATEWWQSPGAITCTPFALPPSPRRTFTGALCTSLGTLEFDLDGALPGPAQIWSDLPSWAVVSFSGTTVTITMSPEAGLATWTRFPFELRVTSGGYTATGRYELIVC